MKKKILATLAVLAALAVPVLPTPFTQAAFAETQDVHEVGVYVYQKLDPSAPASWANSGPQTLVLVVDGDEFVPLSDVPVPPSKCGPLGVQQDAKIHDGTFEWPATVTPPALSIQPWKSQHSELAGPPCATPTPEPTATPPVTTAPPVKKPQPFTQSPQATTLAETGPDERFWLGLGVVVVLIGSGVLAVRTARRGL